jgi:putative heme iron utilization protein
MPIKLSFVCEDCGVIENTGEELIAAAVEGYGEPNEPYKAFVLKDQEFWVPENWHIDLNVYCPECTQKRGLPT